MSGDPFTSDERRRASHVGRMVPVRGKPGCYRITVSQLGSSTSLIMDARVNDTMGADPGSRFDVLGRVADTPDQARLKREGK